MIVLYGNSVVKVQVQYKKNKNRCLYSFKTLIQQKFYYNELNFGVQFDCC